MVENEIKGKIEVEYSFNLHTKLISKVTLSFFNLNELANSSLGRNFQKGILKDLERRLQESQNENK